MLLSVISDHQSAANRSSRRTCAPTSTGIVRLSWNTLACHRQLPTLAGERYNENKKLAGSIASPANEIVACRYTIRTRRRLAPAAPAPGCTATCACHPWHADPYRNTATAATAATKADAASAGSASTAAATATATASAEATTSAAAAASALSQLHAAKDVFVVEEMEGGEADVGKFLLTERDHHAGCVTRRLLNVTGRYGRCRCASC
jgi:hypothetical protein